MNDTTPFAEILTAANAEKHPRNPGQRNPTACQVWRDAETNMSRLLEAAFAWELAVGRVAQAADEPTIRERRAQMDAATAALA
jgi:hypothetical protein